MDPALSNGHLSHVMSVELPLKVTNPQKALVALGGKAEVARAALTPAIETNQLELRLRGDEFHHPLTSRVVSCRNIVLELSIPERFLVQAAGNVKEAVAAAKTAGATVASRAVLIATSSHRFREIADFQMHTGGSKFANKVRESLFAANLDRISTIDLDVPLSDLDRNDILPPPRFSLTTQPFYYQYKQNPSVAVVSDEAGSKVVNRAAGVKVVSSLITWEDPVPTRPPEGIDPHPKEAVQKCINHLVELFNERPCYTRRALQAKLDEGELRHLKHALPHVAFFYRSGPWRSAYIKYGENPMTDKSFARYQVEHFRISTDDQYSGSAAEAHVASSSEDYLFDGTKYPLVPMLQLCDIKDGFLETYIDTQELRATPDFSDGWYMENTMAVIRRVLRAELVSLHDSSRPLTILEKNTIADSVYWGPGELKGYVSPSQRSR